MSNFIKKYVSWTTIAFAFLLGALFMPHEYSGSATLTPGYTFATNELVTAAKLGTLVSSATLSSIVAADITDATITQAKMANNSIGTLQVIDASLTGGDLSNRTITASLIATNTITEIELNTNITTRAGLWDFTLSRFIANSITNVAVLGTTTGGSAGDSGKIVKLNGSGLVDTTILPPSNIIIAEDHRTSGTVGGTASTLAWTIHPMTNLVADSGSIAVLTTNTLTLPAGTYRAQAQVQFDATQDSKIRLRNITDGSTVVVGQSGHANNAANAGGTSYLSGRFTLSGTKNIQLQYYVTISAGTTDLGRTASSGEDDVYSTLTIIKE